MAMTQFEPEDARRALPCFDEPAFKAVFSLTIIHPSDMVAIGNAMEISTELREYNLNLNLKISSVHFYIETNCSDGWKVTKFNPTKKMSTYLLAFAVADFVNQTRVSNTTENTIVRLRKC